MRLVRDFAVEAADGKDAEFQSRLARLPRPRTVEANSDVWKISSERSGGAAAIAGEGKE